MANLRDDTRFETEIISAKWNETEKLWNLQSKCNDTVRTENFTWLISCVGGLHKPFYPKFENDESFTGSKFHTANWNHSVKLKGKRVAVIARFLTN